MKTWLLLAGLAVVGCSNGNTGREPDEYTGCGTDETWRAFEDTEPTATVDDTTAPLVTMPAAGATVPSTSQLKLAWQQDPNDVGQADGDVPYMDGVNGCNMCCPEFNTGALSTLHLPPISGNAYDLQFTVDGKIAWRVITTIQEWAAPDATLASWKGKKVSLKIWRTSLLRNDVKQGPYVGTAPFSFSVGG